MIFAPFKTLGLERCMLSGARICIKQLIVRIILHLKVCVSVLLPN